jgi:hypothetical protein
MQPDVNKLDQLRNQILDNLVSMSDQLAVSDNISYDALIALGRSTGKPEFLEKAYQKINSIEDQSEKADAFLDLLDEVEVQLSESTDNQENQTETQQQS